MEEAQDLTQEFFTRLIEKDYLDSVEPEKGRFRSFLLAAVKHFLANEWDRAAALKRGGGTTTFSIDWASEGGRHAFRPVDHLTPERLFERKWALTTLDQALSQLRAEYEAAGKLLIFESLKASLTGELPRLPFRQIGETHGLSEGAVRAALYRMRRKYRDRIREVIQQTVSREEEVDDEIRFLFESLVLQ